MTEQIFDLLIFDINLPDGNGFSLCREIRGHSRIPIIFLTSNDMELDIVAGLESGADDYITKPFSLMVLRARVNGLLRRIELSDHIDEYQTGSFKFYFRTMKFGK